MQFLPIKLPPVHAPPPPEYFYKSTHIALHEKHRGGDCLGLVVMTSRISGIGSPPTGVGLGTILGMFLLQLFSTDIKSL